LGVGAKKTHTSPLLAVASEFRTCCFQAIAIEADGLWMKTGV
jgi:hypothetical protein